MDLQCSVEWRHDTRLGPQVVRRNADDLLSVAADKGLQDWMGKFEFHTLDVDPFVLERGSSPATVGHNVLIREKGYSQRWMSETSYSTTKRSLESNGVLSQRVDVRGRPLLVAVTADVVGLQRVDIDVRNWHRLPMVEMAA